MARSMFKEYSGMIPRQISRFDLFQVWQNRDFLTTIAVDLKILELPKEDSGMEWK
jgi:hypothetical protein